MIKHLLFDLLVERFDCCDTIGKEYRHSLSLMQTELEIPKGDRGFSDNE